MQAHEKQRLPPPTHAPLNLPDFLTRIPARADPDTHALSLEIAGLRAEIAALRVGLEGASTLILVGREVLDEFRKLRRES